MSKFHFLITYFKPSGKYYTTAVVAWDIRGCDKAGAPNQPYLPDAVDKLRALRDQDRNPAVDGGLGSLPGLHGTSWDGPILIQQATVRCNHSTNPDDYYGDGVPHLLL